MDQAIPGQVVDSSRLQIVQYPKDPVVRQGEDIHVLQKSLQIILTTNQINLELAWTYFHCYSWMIWSLKQTLLIVGGLVFPKRIFNIKIIKILISTGIWFAIEKKQLTSKIEKTKKVTGRWNWSMLINVGDHVVGKVNWKHVLEVTTRSISTEYV